MTNVRGRHMHDGCRQCGGPTGRHAICSACSRNKGTGVHRDKYATRSAATQPPQLRAKGRR